MRVKRGDRGVGNNRSLCRSLKAQDRPRERLVRLGSRALSDTELLALILRTGTRADRADSLARAIVEHTGGLTELSSTSMAALLAIRGLGPAKAASLLAAFELARRLETKPLDLGQPIRNPVDVHRHFQPRIRGVHRESFHVLLLDVRHRLIGEDEVSVGTLTASLVHPREVFREAIRAAAAAVLLVHNHPSGDPTPSAEDRTVTERLVSAGELLGIRVVDHLIVSETGHFSFREAGEGCFAELNAGDRGDR
jgi:DNA repair protein RadC